jgi:hypothetical protein
MKRGILLFTLLLLAGFPVPRAQTPASSKLASIKPEDVANEWFIRLNELDDWHFDGRRKTPAWSILLELYAGRLPSGRATEKQSGAVVFHSRDAIRKCGRLLKSFTALNYRIDTRRGESHGRLRIQFRGEGRARRQFEAIYTNRQDRKQFVVPASVFSSRQAGKIEAFSCLLRDEAAEIG